MVNFDWFIFQELQPQIALAYISITLYTLLVTLLNMRPYKNVKFITVINKDFILKIVMVEGVAINMENFVVCMLYLVFFFC